VIIRRGRYPGLIAAVLILWLALDSALAAACSIDGVVSLSANGQPAQITASTPTPTDLGTWAPFTLFAVAANRPIHFEENLQELRRTLPASAFDTAFRWSFGDGVTAYGRIANHRYPRTGVYRLQVSFALSPGRWVTFDSARVPIVQQADLWRANLGYTIRQDAQAVMRVLIWLSLGAGLLWLLWRRGRRAPHPDAEHGPS
jgi:hypothetical protein